MSTIKFSKEEKTALIAKVQKYFDSQLQQEIGTFDAEFLIDFFSAELGKYYYNRGLQDAQIILNSKMQTITDAISELEKPTDIVR